MKAIRIENLRSLADTDWVNLKPITLLLGENSSGKSTFLRTFPLLRQSMEARTEVPLLWFGDYVDFGDFQTALNKFSEREDITFKFSFPTRRSVGFSLERRPSIGSFRPPSVGSSMYSSYSDLNILDDLDIILTLKMTHDKKNQTQITSYHIDFADHKIIMELNDSKSISLAVNAHRFPFSMDNMPYGMSILFPRMSILPEELDLSIDFQEQVDPLDWLYDEAKPNVSETTIDEFVDNIKLGSSARMLNEIKHNEYSDIWEKNSDDWDIRLRDLVIAYHIPEIFSFCDGYLVNVARNVKYFGPLRATSERFYRFQNLAVDEVDFQGQNLGMFLNNLTAEQRENFSAWTEKFFNFTFHPQQQGAHISLQLREQGSDNEFNLSDMGFGFSQILPVITQLWAFKGPGRYTFAIEQPELHLHPRLQALLADAFLGAVQADKKWGGAIRLIIETHSEAMVNRFGHRIAQGDLDPQDINVVIFEKERVDGPSQVRFSGYDSEGFLTNWPYGFFEPEVG